MKLKNLLLYIFFLVSVPGMHIIAEEQVDRSSVSVNFRNVDIRIISQSVGKVLGKNIMIDPRVKGTVTVYAEDRIPVQNLLDVIRMIFSQQGFDIVDAPYGLMVVPSQVSPSIVPTNISGENYEQITEVLTLNNIPANSVLPILQPFLTQYAKLQVIPNTSKMVVTDLAINVDRVKKIIRQIDTVLVNDFDAIELKFGSATDILATLRSLFNDAPVKFEVDVRSNKIFVISNSRELRLAARAIIAEFDTELKSQRKGNMEVFFLKYSKAEKLAPILTTMLSSNAYSDLEYSTNVISAQSSIVGGKVGTPPPQTKAPPVPAAGAPSPAQPPQTGQPSGSNPQAKPGEKEEAKFSIQADNDLNAIVVIGEYAVLDAVGYFIERLDIPRAQVAIDVIIAELSDAKTKDLGIDYTALSSGAEISGVGWGTLINLIQADTKSRLLSTPYMTALDNSEVKFVVGEERPFTTGSYTSTGDSSNPDEPFQTIERKNVGIEVTITPQINDGKTITLDAKQKISAVLPGSETTDSDNVITTNRELNNQLIVNSGQIVVMGGLGQEEVNEVEKGIPYMKEIPVLGYLFKFKSQEVNRKTIAIFIRTTILNDVEDIKTMSLYKYSRFRNHMVQQGLPGLSNNLTTFDNTFVNQSYEQRTSIDKIDEQSLRNLQSVGSTDLVSGSISPQTLERQQDALKKAEIIYKENLTKNEEETKEILDSIVNTQKNNAKSGQDITPSMEEVRAETINPELTPEQKVVPTDSK